MQVARQHDPQQDAAMVLAVRHAVGAGIVLRADANRKWSLNQAVAFGHAVSAATLQVLLHLSMATSSTLRKLLHFCSHVSQLLLAFLTAST